MNDDKLYSIHDRMNELIKEITYKCARMFPEHFDDICRQLLVECRDIVDDSEIIEWIGEYRHLESEAKKDNPWITMLERNSEN